jgi:cytochrome c oxidase assembly factor CtaG
MRRATGLCLAAATQLAAHPGQPVEPHDLWTAWQLDPAVVLALLAAALLYGDAAGQPVRRKLIFWAGWASLAMALVSPLHALGEVLFAGHMAQHEVLMLIAAPLLVVSRPLSPLLKSLPVACRHAIGRICSTRAFRRGSAAIMDPLSAAAIHGAALWLWHIPAVFQATLTSGLVHSAQHISFFGSALLFWRALDREERGSGVAALCTFATMMHSGVLGALLTLSPKVWYPAYGLSGAPWGLTPLEDQQLGGLIMWLPAGLLYTAAGLFLLNRWLKTSDAVHGNDVRSPESPVLRGPGRPAPAAPQHSPSPTPSARA